MCVHVQMCDNHTFPAVKCTFGDIDLDKKITPAANAVNEAP